MLPPVRRNGSPAVTTRTSVVFKNDLDGLVGAAIEEVVGLGGMLERDAVGDEVGEHKFAEQTGRRREPALTVPARREQWRDAPDLRAHDPDAAAVELTAEIDSHGLVAVPRAHDHGALDCDGIDGLLQR